MNSDWFAKDIKLLGQNKKIILFTHFDPKEENFKIWAKYPNIQAVFSGHRHGTTILRNYGILSVNSGTFRFGAIDYTPAGYRVIHVIGDSLFTQYKFFKENTNNVGANLQESVAKLTDKQILKLPEWRQYKNSSDRTGFVGKSLQSHYALVWQKKLQGIILRSAAVSSRGKVFIGTRNFNSDKGHYLYCLKMKDGNLLWRRELESPILLSPTIDKGNVYCQTQMGDVYCFDFNGKLVWHYQQDFSKQNSVFGAPIIEGNKLFAGNTEIIVCLDKNTGEVIWQKHYGCHFSNVILTAGEKYLVTGCIWSKNNLLFLNKSNGEIAEQMDSPEFTTAAVYQKTNYYILGYQGEFAIFNEKNCSKINSFKLKKNDWLVTTPSLFQNMLYLIDNEGVLRALNIDNNLKENWHFQPDKGMYNFIPYHDYPSLLVSSPLISKNLIIFASSDGNMYILERKSGKVIQKLSFNSPITSTPALSGSLLFIGTFNGTFYCLFGE